MIVIDPSVAVAPYEQVRSQLVALVERGDLNPGDRLPTVRRLADDLGLATNTVARAYRELEQAGVIETRGRAGSFVTGNRVEGEAKAAAAAFVDRVRALGVPDASALALVQHALRKP
jgi:DNA-binding transcriptional regulator YhcF (GntR family)